jgi:hypothetical protein
LPYSSAISSASVLAREYQFCQPQRQVNVLKLMILPSKPQVLTNADLETRSNWDLLILSEKAGPISMMNSDADSCISKLACVRYHCVVNA